MTVRSALKLARAAALLLALLGASRALAVPSVERPVTDLPDVLSPADVERIARVIADHRARTGVQIAVLLVDSTDGAPLEDFSIETAESWRGGDPARDTGVLIIVATRDQRARLEVGYGLEADLTDARARTLLDAARPQLAQGAYAEAILGLVWGIVDATRDVRPPDRGGTGRGVTEAPHHRDRDFPEWWVTLGIAVALLLAIWIVGRKRWRQIQRRNRARRQSGAR